MTDTLKQADLEQFIGTDNLYRHLLNRRILMTDGIAHLSTHGAGWLVDEIAIRQTGRVAHEEFQVWNLNVDTEKHTASLICDDGNGEVLHSYNIGYTDFPFSDQKVYVAANGVELNGKTMMLPSEY
jgi:hypothetical protein